LLRLIREKKITGVRLDHVDGLYDPLSYLRQLQEECYLQLTGAETGLTPPDALEYLEVLQQKPSYRPFYAVCEKILMKGEQLPSDWPVFGSTGYDFANQVNGILVETENAKAFDRIYSRFVGLNTDFAELVYQKKKLVMEVSLSGEVNMLGHHLNSISEQDRLTRDFTLNSLTRAISEVIALFPVYRTYVDSASVREKDVQYIEATLAKAKRKNPAMNASIFDFLRDVLLLRVPEQAGEHDKTAWLNFAMRFQQLTGPVMAKGVEDTTFYIYNRLISLNDVGGTPGRFGTPLELFHGQNLERLKSFPHAMINTATHDSKRGEDLRARIDALSEIPERWQKSLLKWSRQNRKKGVQLDQVTVPGRNEEYLLYQTLLGAWPFGEMDTAAYEIFRSRIKEYLTKAVREAKVNTSWNSPNSSYEAAFSAFVDAILARGSGNAFLADFVPLQRLIAHFGIFNSLSQTLLKMVSPGVPDFYQGTELWDFSLVDPDNRGEVDYQIRSAALAGLKAREAEIGPGKLFGELLACREDGRIKLYLIYRVLNYRKANRELFDHGEYLPVEAPGVRARNLCAFARRAGGRSIIAIAPRFPLTLAPEPGQAPLGERAWLNTSLKLPEGEAGSYRNVITGESLDSTEQAGGAVISLAQIFASAPVALLEKV
jgi:(1->4)-alpha-D-glucan 1-alpha-D-glucosylmutase